MNLTKTSLIEAMKKCLPGVEKGSSLIEGADAFLFTGTHIHTYNDSIAVSVPVALDGLVGAVKALDFFKLVSKLNAPLITGEISGEGKLILQAGRAKASINMIATQTESYIQELDLKELTWLEVPPNFHEALRLCKMSCNPTPLRGICVEKDHMTSTDSVRINDFTLAFTMQSFWLDDPTVTEMMKLGSPVQYAIFGPWFHAKLTDGTIFSAKRKDHSQYPSALIVDQIKQIQSVPEGLLLHNRLPKAIAEVVDRVSTMASGESASSQLIRMTFTATEIILYAKKSTGEVEESVLLDTPFEVDPNLVLWVESSFLLEASKKVMDFYVVRPAPAEEADECVELPNLVFHSPNYIQLASTNTGL